MFHIVQQQLHEYTPALPDLLSYVTYSLISVTYVEHVPQASYFIDYRRVLQELVAAV